MKFKSFPLTVSAVFAISAIPSNAALLLESFTYPDGAIVGAIGSPWVNNTGTAGQSDVTLGELNIVSTETGDIAAPFSTAVASGILTATFDVNFSVLPTTTGAYFAHFIASAPQNNFVGRIWAARPTGTGATSYRLGIANSTNTANFITVDLATATSYTLTLSLDLASDIATLVINSGVTVLGSASGTDVVFNATSLDRFGFRQATGEGTLRVDNLEVIPEPTSVMLGASGLLGLLRRRR